MYGKDYMDIDVDVNGGLTYGQVEEIFGVKYFVFGWDTAHGWDSWAMWPKERVIKENLELVKFFEEHAIPHP